MIGGASGLLAALAMRAAPGTRRRDPSRDPLAVPEPEREFRGAWVATVGNIDWPSERGLPKERQQEELVALFDRLKAARFNAVVFQVRPACDALYLSEKEPWSEFLTGTMGKSPGWDPLETAVKEAHKRGMELHAWFNPFRALPPIAKSPVSDRHIARIKPEWVRRYGSLHWLDPSEPGVGQHTLDVILDVVRRYGIDGVHIDDYFYPYRVKDSATGEPLSFPDDGNWKRYKEAGGDLNRDDWRRSHVDAFVERLYAEVKAVRREVKVGVSPFGIWRPGNPAQIKGLDAFTEIYADSRRWFREGWLDYLAPQLYWRVDQPGQSFPVLLQWWASQNGANRHLFPGLYASKHAPVEIEYQTRITRGTQGAGGNIHFSSKPLMSGSVDDKSSLIGHLASTVYAQPALVPSTPWLSDSNAPASLPVQRDGETVLWNSHSNHRWVLAQWFAKDRWWQSIQPASKGRWAIPKDAVRVAVSAVDPLGRTSDPVDPLR